MWLAPREYRTLQAEYLAWLDVRLKAGESLDKHMRIDQTNGSRLQNVLAHGLFARDRDPGDTVAAQIHGDVVTFRYDGGVHDSELMATPSVAKYRIIDGHPVRQVPISLTRAGFISEWLSMTDADPSRWADPQPLKMRKTVAAAVTKHGIAWADIAVCGGSTPVWEVAVRVNHTQQLYVFHISGARATDLRMLTMDDKLTPSCARQDIDPATLGDELPW